MYVGFLLLNQNETLHIFVRLHEFCDSYEPILIISIVFFVFFFSIIVFYYSKEKKVLF